MEIKSNYKKIKIKNISFSDPTTIYKDICGKFIADTNTAKLLGEDSLDTDDGFYVMQALYDPTKIVKYYKDCNPITYKYVSHESDVSFIKRLIDKQELVKLSKFPTGIVTLNDKVVGHEATYYQNEKSLNDEMNSLTLDDMIYYLKYMIKMLDEMFSAGIAYNDIHLNNFLVNREKVILHLIDFDKKYVVFDDNKEFFKNNYKKMIDAFKISVLKVINKFYNISIDISNCTSFNDIEELLENFNNKIK